MIWISGTTWGQGIKSLSRQTTRVKYEESKMHLPHTGNGAQCVRASMREQEGPGALRM